MSVKRFLVQHQTSTEDGHEVDYATDLSETGLFIRSPRRPPPSATVHLQFSPLKNSGLVSLFALVTHVTSEGFGAQFIDLDPENRSAILAALT